MTEALFAPPPEELAPRASRPAWLKDAPYAWRPTDIDLEPRWDFAFGRQYEVLRERFPEIFREHYDPERLASAPYRAPRDVEAAAADIFGDKWRSGRTLPGEVLLKFAVHPWWGRVCLWERERGGGRGPDNWRVKQVFHRADTVREDYLPPDLDTFDRQVLRGVIGDFCQPTREWLEWVVENCDREYTSRGEYEPRKDRVPQGCAPGVGIFKRLLEPRDRAFKEANDRMRDQDMDMLDYAFQFVRDLSQDHYSAGLSVYGRSHDELRRRRGREDASSWEAQTKLLPSGGKYTQYLKKPMRKPKVETTYFRAEFERLQRARVGEIPTDNHLLLAGVDMAEPVEAAEASPVSLERPSRRHLLSAEDFMPDRPIAQEKATEAAPKRGVVQQRVAPWYK